MSYEELQDAMKRGVNCYVYRNLDKIQGELWTASKRGAKILLNNPPDYVLLCCFRVKAVRGIVPAY
jgi:hypothetical protein